MKTTLWEEIYTKKLYTLKSDLCETIIIWDQKTTE